jgi:hypothetical protein
MAAVLLAALVFMGCPTEADDDSDSGLQPVPPAGWTAVDTGTTKALSGVAYGGGKFVAVGGANPGAVGLFSYDGITWTDVEKRAESSKKISTVFFRNPSRVAFLDNRFIASIGSGTGDYVGTSDDGIGWDKIDSSKIGFGCKGLGYGDGTYVFGGQQGKIAYSTDDGATWTTLQNTATTFTGSSSAGYVNAIVYGNGKFVAGGGNGHVAYSTDGTAWTALLAVDTEVGPNSVTENIFDNGFINGMVYADGKFVAVGGADAGPGKAAYSTDGIAWTQSGDIKIGTETVIEGIAYGDGYFVAVDRAGTASYSSNGISWTLIADTTFDGNSINGVVYGNGKFVIVGAGGKAAYVNVR